MRKMICIFIILVVLIFPVSGLAAEATPEQALKQAVKDYFDLRYTILSTLNYDAHVNTFLAPEVLNSGDVINEADVLETVVKYRKIQMNDLRFERYKYNIDYTSMKIDGEKAWMVFSESYELYYNCAPTVRNQAVIEHIAMYRNVNGKWLIAKDDYSDPDGIRKLLNSNFLENHVSKEEAKKMVLEQSENQAGSRLDTLQELMAGEDDSKLAVFFRGRNIACIAGEAGRIDSDGGVAALDVNGTAMLPVRYTAEKLGAEVLWDGKTSKVKIIFNGHEASFKAGDRTILIDGFDVPLKEPVKEVKERTMLPAEALAQILGKKAYYDPDGLIILSNGDFDSTKNEELVSKLTNFFDVLFTKASFPRIDGSTATYPLSMEIGKELLGLDEIGVKGFITHKTTHNAYVNLIDGNADIIFVTQPSPDEYALAEQKGVELEVVPICKEGFVFLVNKENPVNNLAVKQVQDIYKGIIKNWKEVGGEDREIVPYQREANSGSQTIMENTVMKGMKMVAPPKEVLVYGMGELIDKVADFSNAKNALGYSVYYYATTMYQNRAVKLLSIDGVQPDKQTIKDGTYPFTVSYYAVVRKDEPKDSSARKLLKWLLGEEGQTIVDRSGLVPVK